MIFERESTVSILGGWFMSGIREFDCKDEDAVAVIEGTFGKFDSVSYPVLEDVINQLPALYPVDLPKVLAAVLVSIVRHREGGRPVFGALVDVLYYFCTDDSAIGYNAVVKRVFGPDSGLECAVGDDDVLTKSKLEQWATFNESQCRAVLCWISCVMKWTDLGRHIDEQDYEKASRYWLGRIRGQTAAEGTSQISS